MELISAIEKRRSIRKFTQKDISNKEIEDILKCGILAPSPKNKQPWYFVVVKNQIKDEIAELMLKYKCSNSKDFGYPISIKYTAKIIKESPVLVLVFREKDDRWIEGDNLAIGACVENICLRATDLGIGSLWIRDIMYVSNEIAKLVNHSELELNCAISLGYANEFPKKRPRKKLEQITEWIE